MKSAEFENLSVCPTCPNAVEDQLFLPTSNNPTSSMMEHSFSFTSYMLAPKPRTHYPNVTAKVLSNERLERAIHDAAREKLQQQHPSKTHKRSKRVHHHHHHHQPSPSQEDDDCLIEDKLNSVPLINNVITPETMADELTKRLTGLSGNDLESTSTSAESSGVSSEVSSPCNCAENPFSFSTLTSRSTFCESDHDLNSNKSTCNSPSANHPRTAAAVADYELQFARLVADQKRRAADLLRQMKTCVSSTLLRLAGWILIKILSRLFNNIHYLDSELQTIRDIAQQRRVPIVFLPMHRSHLDYIVISFVLYMKGIAPPLVAAGDNLNIPVFGNLMRGLGAFFIRRKMDPVAGTRDHVYRSLLQAYVTENLKSGQNLEFFIEGGRSRTGKALLPKAGLLSVVVDTVLTNQVPDVQLVPVGVSYEKLIDGGFISEQLGGAKKAESFLLAAKSIWRKLTSGRYGDVRLTFAPPFSLRDFITQHEQCSEAGSLVSSPLVGCESNCSSTGQTPDILGSIPTVLDENNKVSCLFGDVEERSQKVEKEGSEKVSEIISKGSLITFGRHQSDTCCVCQPLSSTVITLKGAKLFSSNNFSPITADHRREIIQSLADHVTYSAFAGCTVMDTHAVCALLLYRYRKGCTLKQLAHSLEMLRDQLHQRGRECSFNRRTVDQVMNTIQLLGKDSVHRLRCRLESLDQLDLCGRSRENSVCSVEFNSHLLQQQQLSLSCATSTTSLDLCGKSNSKSSPTPDGHLYFIRPNLRSPNVLQLHYNASNCTSAFVLDSVLATVLCSSVDNCQSPSRVPSGFLERISVDSGLGVDAPADPPRYLRHECILRALRLCELLRFEYVFVPACVQLRDALERVFDEFLSLGYLQSVELTDFERAQIGRRRRGSDRVGFVEGDLMQQSPIVIEPSWTNSSTNSTFNCKPSSLLNRRYQLDLIKLDQIRFFNLMLAPILDSYITLISCLHHLIDNPMEERRFLLYVLEHGRNCLDRGTLQFEESLATEPFRNALKLLEQEKVIFTEESNGIRRLRLYARYRNEQNLRKLLNQYQQYCV